MGTLVDYKFRIGTQSTLKVTPPKHNVGPGDQVIWINHWPDSVEVMFYKGDLVFVEFPLDHKFTLEAFGRPGSERTFEVRSDAKRREYTYQVYCSQNGEFAEGESDPKINVRW
jgi:hypothetical protein